MHNGGGAGFIGSHIVEELLGRGFTVVVLDDLSTGKLENLPLGNERLLFMEGSILDTEKIAEGLRGCKAVIHLAAISSVQASIDDPLVTHGINFDGTLLLLEAARKAGVKRFLFASSAAVYGDASKGAVSESGAVSPLTPYAIDKLASEYYLAHYQRTFGIACTAFRFFNVYGPRQNPSSPYSGVVSIFISNSLAGKAVKIFGDGKQTRDFVYVKDICRILVDAIDNKKMHDKTINLGTGGSVSLLEVIEKIGTILQREVDIEYAEARLGDIKHSLANIELLKSLGVAIPSTPILDGLRAIISR